MCRMKVLKLDWCVYFENDSCVYILLNGLF